MGLSYYIDGTLPQSVVSDVVVWFEQMFDKCPSDSLLCFSLLSIGDRFLLDVSLVSSTIQFRESLESTSLLSLKRGLVSTFQSRLEGWRETKGSA